MLVLFIPISDEDGRRMIQLFAQLSIIEMYLGTSGRKQEEPQDVRRKSLRL